MITDLQKSKLRRGMIEYVKSISLEDYKYLLHLFKLKNHIELS